MKDERSSSSVIYHSSFVKLYHRQALKYTIINASLKLINAKICLFHSIDIH